MASERSPFSVAFERAHAFGHLVGVQLPDDHRPVAAEVLQRLDSAEAEYATRLTGFRQREWVGGRLAASMAGRHLGCVRWTVGTGPRGEPQPPAGVRVSVAHKRGLAVALVSTDASPPVGVDLEDDATAAMHIEEIVFSTLELERLAALEESERPRARVLGFALKEAVYKACALSSARPLVFHDAVVAWRGIDDATIELMASVPTTLFDVAIEWRDAQVIAAVRVRGQSRRRNPSNSGH